MNVSKAVALAFLATAPVTAAAAGPEQGLSPVHLSSAGGSDWTGFYAGLQFGRTSGDWIGASGATVSSDSAGSYGFHIGYAHDLGQWVVGAELDHDRAELTYSIPIAGGGAVAGTEEHGITRLKLRAGYDLGPALAYATIGIAELDSSILDYDTGTVTGLGVAWQAMPDVVMGLELLDHDFEHRNVAVEATTVNLRLTYRF